MTDFENQIDIELEEDLADGVYSNFTIIAHSSSEFVLDFIQLMPGVNEAKVKSRVILPPEQAKRLLLSLQENVLDYEAKYGNIDMHFSQFDKESLLAYAPTGEA